MFEPLLKFSIGVRTNSCPSCKDPKSNCDNSTCVRTDTTSKGLEKFISQDIITIFKSLFTCDRPVTLEIIADNDMRYKLLCQELSTDSVKIVKLDDISHALGQLFKTDQKKIKKLLDSKLGVDNLLKKKVSTTFIKALHRNLAYCFFQNFTSFKK